MTEQPASDPPPVGYAVIEVDVAPDRAEPVHAFLRGIHPTREEAEREKRQINEAYERAIDDRDEEPYEYRRVTIHEKALYRLDELDTMDEESHALLQNASNAVAASLLADEIDGTDGTTTREHDSDE